MPNTEDYLDGLLDSITQAKADVRNNERKERSGREARRRNRLSPDDDFMEANGLYGASSRRAGRRGGRRRSFDESFFDDFGNDLDEGDDDFIRAFERELEAGDDGDDAFDIRDHTRETGRVEMKTPTAPEIPEEEAPSETDAILGDIAGIVSEAKAKIENSDDDLLHTINEQMDKPAAASFTAGMESSETAETPQEEPNEEPLLSPEFAEDELDLADAGEPAGEISPEPDLSDEGGDDMDLMDMLAADGDEELVDIGELLNSDETGEELSETREAFEAGAESAAGGGGGAEGDAPVMTDTIEEEKKPGLLARILSIFKKKDEDGTSAVGAVDPTPEQLAAESEEIVGEFENGEDGEDDESPEERKARKKKEKEEAKAKKKAEKDAAKKAKDAEKKAAADKKAAAKAAKAAAKANKPKKKKKKDNSPKIPLFAIVPFLILGASVVVGVQIITNVLGYQEPVADAYASYEKKDYIDAYADIAGIDLNATDEDLRDKAKTMAFLQTKYEEYQVCMNLGKYQMALDSLVDGMNFYVKNAKTAEKLGISEEYDELGASIEHQLATEFNLSADDAVEMYKSLTRREYTTQIQRAVKAAGLEDEY